MGTLRPTITLAIAEHTLEEGERLVVAGAVRNDGEQPWVIEHGSPSRLRAGLQLYDTQNKRVFQARSDFKCDVIEPGAEVAFSIAVPQGVLELGKFRAMVDLLYEGQFWFHTKGSEPVWAEVEVKRPDGFVDVKELIERYTVEDLCESAEAYFAGRRDQVEPRRKPFRINAIQHALPNFAYMVRGTDLAPGMTVLDFGCGVGWTSRFLCQLGLDVISLDVSRTALEMGAEVGDTWPTYPEQGKQTFLHYDGHKIDLPDDSVDRIFCMDAFHHVPRPYEVLEDMARVLREGGIAAFCEPGPNHSKTPKSQREMQTFKVIENDIDVEEIFARSKAMGFTEMRFALSNLLPQIVDLADYLKFPNDEKLVRDYLHRTKQRITNHPIFFLHKGDTKVRDSRNRDGLLADIAVLSGTAVQVAAGEPVSIDLQISNTTDRTWLTEGHGTGSVVIGAFIFDKAAESLKQAGQKRFPLSNKNVKPGESVRTQISVGPFESNSVRIEIDLCSQNICWFHENGSKKAVVDVEVR